MRKGGRRREAAEVEVERQYFTLEQANRLLPLVRVIARDVVATSRAARELKERLEALPADRREGATAAHREEIEQSWRELDELRAELRRLVDELESLGLRLADPTDGVVRFPSRWRGQPIWLEWVYEQPQVAWWRQAKGKQVASKPIPRSWLRRPESWSAAEGKATARRSRRPAGQGRGHKNRRGRGGKGGS